MKYCSNCGNAVEDSALFCDKCGTRFTTQNDVVTNQVQQPANQVNYTQPPQYNYGANQTQYQPVSVQPKQKENKTGLIIGIVAAVLIVLSIIGFVAEKAFQNQGYGQSSDTDYDTYYDFDDTDGLVEENSNSQISNETIAATSYTKGSVVNGVYVNEWANLSYDTSGWTEGSTEEYSTYEGDGKTECGLLLNSTDGDQIVVGFENLGVINSSLSEEDYLDIVVDGLEGEFANMGLTASVSDYYDFTIAGETYKAAKITFDEVGSVQEFYVRNYDGYMIFMVITAQDGFDATTAVNNFRAVD